MIIWVARIESDKPAHVLDVFLQQSKLSGSSPVDLLAEQHDDHIRVGIASQVDPIALSVAHHIFTCAEAASAKVDLKLIWISSVRPVKITRSM